MAYKVDSMMRISASALLTAALLAFGGCGGGSETSTSEARAKKLAALDKEVAALDKKDEQLRKDIEASGAASDRLLLRADFERAEPHLQGLCERSKSTGDISQSDYSDDLKILKRIQQKDPEALRPEMIALANEMQTCLPEVSASIDEFLGID